MLKLSSLCFVNPSPGNQIMASFRSGFKIICDKSKNEGQGFFRRCLSHDRSLFGHVRRLIPRADQEVREDAKVKRSVPRVSSWLSLWVTSDPGGQTSEEGAGGAVVNDPLISSASLVCTIPTTQLTASPELTSCTAGTVRRMLDLQQRHLHPKHAIQAASSVNYASKMAPKAEFKAPPSQQLSHEPCDARPLTPRQATFIEKLKDATQPSSGKDLEVVSYPSQLCPTQGGVATTPSLEPPSFRLHPTALYQSLKRVFQSNPFAMRSPFFPGIQDKRLFSTSILDPPLSSRLAAVECAGKKGKGGGKSKKPDCVKVPSGLQGSSGSSGKCDKYKLPGCKTPASTDCRPKPMKRSPCKKLEAPMPSYSECVKEPTPAARATECPTRDRGPPADCVEVRLGISIDGCNPPKPKIPICRPREKRVMPKSKTKKCVVDRDPCENVELYKEDDVGKSGGKKKAGAGSKATEMKCLSSRTTSRVTEPMYVHNPIINPKRYFSNAQVDPPLYPGIGSVECAGKKGKGGGKTKGKKPDCVKVPSGLQGSSGSSGKCDKYKLPGCKTPASTDCRPKPMKRSPCKKLEAPMPSYSECVKEPTPAARATECPTRDRGPPADCVEVRLGISIDGCNPPKPNIPICRPREKRVMPKSKTKKCVVDRDPCENVKVYKEDDVGKSGGKKKADAGLSNLPKKCPAASSLHGVSEPTNVLHQVLPPRRCYSSSAMVEPPAQPRHQFLCSSSRNCKDGSGGKDKKKSCFVAEKLKKKEVAKDTGSRVSCSMKTEKKGKCDAPTYQRPWKTCSKPTPLFQHKCPPPKPRPAVVPPPPPPPKTYKECNKPPNTTHNFRCVEPPPPPPPPPPPQVPTRCRCDDDPKDLPPPDPRACKKVKGAKKPRDCTTQLHPECNTCKNKD